MQRHPARRIGNNSEEKPTGRPLQKDGLTAACRSGKHTECWSLHAFVIVTAEFVLANRFSVPVAIEFPDYAAYICCTFTHAPRRFSWNAVIVPTMACSRENEESQLVLTAQLVPESSSKSCGHSAVQTVHWKKTVLSMVQLFELE
jgi:hypothetical protein